MRKKTQTATAAIGDNGVLGGWAKANGKKATKIGQLQPLAKDGEE